jgi:hypothetical protein
MDKAPDAASLLAGLRRGYEVSIDSIPGFAKPWREMQRRYGIARLDAYEWQMHLHGHANRAVKLAATLDPGAAPVIKELAHALRRAGFQTMCFLSASPQEPNPEDVNSFAWALTRGFSPPWSPKAQAVRELIQESGQ